MENLLKPPSCEHCRFSKYDLAEKRLACHRLPPVPHPIMMPPRLEGQAPGMGIVNVRPGVAPEDWCGEWEALPG